MINMRDVIMLTLNSFKSTVRVVALGTFVNCMLLGCSDVGGPGQEPVPIDDVLSYANINVNSVMMQVGDTLQLSARGFAINGTEIDLQQADSISWASANADNVSIDSSTGLIKALRASTLPVEVRMTVTYNSITKTHRIPVYVTSYRLDVTDVRLIALDSLRIGTGTSPFAGTTSMTGVPRIRVDLYNGDNLVEEGSNIPLRSPVTLQYVSAQRVYQVYNLSYLGKFNVEVDGNIYGKEISSSIEFEGIYQARLAISDFGYSSTIYSPDGGSAVIVEIDSAWVTGNNHTTDTYFVQPCALVGFSGFSYGFIYLFYDPEFKVPPIDIVFSDSATTADCGASNITDPMSSEVIGGNIYNWNSADRAIYRKASQPGEVSWYLRDAVTKEPLGITGKYIIRGPEQ